MPERRYSPGRLRLTRSWRVTTIGHGQRSSAPSSQGLWETAPEHFERRRAFLLSRVEQADRVLDVGCGEGWFCAALAEAGVVNVLGVDVAAEAVRRARARYP